MQNICQLIGLEEYNICRIVFSISIVSSFSEY